MNESQLQRLDRAHASIRSRAGPACDVAIMLGSGLGQLADLAPRGDEHLLGDVLRLGAVGEHP